MLLVNFWIAGEALVLLSYQWRLVSRCQRGWRIGSGLWPLKRQNELTTYSPTAGPNPISPTIQACVLQAVWKWHRVLKLSQHWRQKYLRWDSVKSVARGSLPLVLRVLHITNFHRGQVRGWWRWRGSFGLWVYWKLCRILTCASSYSIMFVFLSLEKSFVVLPWLSAFFLRGFCKAAVK